jgi:hypothetical protein
LIGQEQGPYGHGWVFAEVSDKMGTGEWVYLMVQDSSTGHVITLQVGSKAYLHTTRHTQPVITENRQGV